MQASPMGIRNSGTPTPRHKSPNIPIASSDEPANGGPAFLGQRHPEVFDALPVPLGVPARVRPRGGPVVHQSWRVRVHLSRAATE